MSRMPIALFDVQEQEAFRAAKKQYAEDTKAASELGTPWPAYPVEPGPMVDSKDPGQTFEGPYGLVGPVFANGPIIGKDPTALDVPVAHDGTSASNIKGFESKQSSPFTVKR